MVVIVSIRSTPSRSHPRLDGARGPGSAENHLAVHHCQGAARLPLQTAEHYVAVEALEALQALDNRKAASPRAGTRSDRPTAARAAHRRGTRAARVARARGLVASGARRGTGGLAPDRDVAAGRAGDHHADRDTEGVGAARPGHAGRSVHANFSTRYGVPTGTRTVLPNRIVWRYEARGVTAGSHARQPAALRRCPAVALWDSETSMRKGRANHGTVRASI